MAQFEPHADEIEAAGARLVYIAAERRTGLFKPEKYLREHPVHFPFLLDEDRAVTRAYGVYHALGLDAYKIARPASFVAGRQGIIRFVYIGADQHDRTPIEEIMRACR